MTQHEVDQPNPRAVGSDTLAMPQADAQPADAHAGIGPAAIEAPSPCSTSADTQRTAVLNQRAPALDPLQAASPPAGAPASDVLQPSGTASGHQPPTAAPAVPASNRGSGAGSPLHA
jgi:hypothetical protein